MCALAFCFRRCVLRYVYVQMSLQLWCRSDSLRVGMGFVGNISGVSNNVEGMPWLRYADF